MVRELRGERGFTQETLAFACDRSPHFVSDIERAKYSMSVRTRFAMAAALGTRPSEILHRAEDLIESR